MKYSKGTDLIQGHLAKIAILDVKTCPSVKLAQQQKRKPAPHCELCIMRVLLSILLSCTITGTSFLHLVMLLYRMYTSVSLPQSKSSFPYDILTSLPPLHHRVFVYKTAKCVVSFSDSLSNGAGYGIGCLVP